MTYDPNQPNPNDDLDVSQPKLLLNSQQLDIVFGVNHFKFSDLSGNAGKHTFVELVGVSVDPVAGSGENVLFSKSVAGKTQMFYRRSSGGPIQLTGPETPVIADNGYTFLPGGIMLQWGRIASTNNSYTQLNFATGNVNFLNDCFQVWTQVVGDLSIPSASANIVIDPTSLDRFGFKWAFIKSGSTSHYTGFYWAAIGW